jgi:hypothetical protein
MGSTRQLPSTLAFKHIFQQASVGTALLLAALPLAARLQGLVQYYFPMGDGSGLKLTAAKYLTPKAYDITKFGGLTPDFACKDYPHGERVCCWGAAAGLSLTRRMCAAGFVYCMPHLGRHYKQRVC